MIAEKGILRKAINVGTSPISGVSFTKYLLNRLITWPVFKFKMIPIFYTAPTWRV